MASLGERPWPCGHHPTLNPDMLWKQPSYLFIGPCETGLPASPSRDLVAAAILKKNHLVQRIFEQRPPS
jgi:hypothetical protein